MANNPGAWFILYYQFKQNEPAGVTIGRQTMKRLICLFLLGLTSSNAWADATVELEPIVVTASRMAQHDYKIAGNVTVINRSQIEASNAQNVPDLLKESLGVSVFNFGTTKSANIDIRGFGETAPSNVLVLINDRKINSIDISGPDLSRIPVGSIERIEIIRGAGSVLYGDNAVGGVVNIITKQGRGNLTGSVGAKYGSYDTQGTDIKVSGLKNNISYFIYSNYNDQRGYRQNSDVLAKDFNTRLGYAFTDKISADLNVMWHEDDSGLPGSLSDSNLRTLGRRASTTESDFTSTKDRSFNLSLDINPWPEDIYFGDFVLDLSYRNRDVYSSYAGYNDSKQSIDTKGVGAKYIFDRTVFNKEVNFVTGIDYYDNENDLLGSNGSTADITISKGDMGIYSFLQYEAMDHVFVSGGTRYHKADYTFNNRGTGLFEQQDPSNWVSMGGMKYEYAKGSNVHFNVQQTFRYLATDEWYNSFTDVLNTSLEQQTGIQYEIGVKHNFADKVITQITPYLININNEIYFNPNNFTNSNYDKTRRIGVEVGNTVDVLKFIDVGFLDKLEFFSNYTYQNPRLNGGDSDGKYIPLASRHQISSGLIADFWGHFRTSLLTKYVGSRFAISDFDNVGSKLKPYYVVDSKLAYNADNFEVYAAVNNMFNELYDDSVVFISGLGNLHYPAAERNFTVGANLKF